MPDDLFGRRLLVVSGKGGVGKTTVASALALLAARQGKKVLLVSSDGRGDAASFFGEKDPGYEERSFAPGLWGLTVEFDAVLADYVHTAVPVRMVAEKILESSTFRYFTRATPGLPELLHLGKVREVLQRKGRAKGKRLYDLVVLDAPASGHALSLLAMPGTLVKTIPAGPLRKVANDLDRILEDPEAALLVVVAEPAELPAREAEEMVETARERSGLSTGLLVLNRVGRGGPSESAVRVSGVPTARVPELTPPDESGPGEFLDAVAAAIEGKAVPRAARPRGTIELPSTFDALRWLSREKLVVLAGPGGVGKTTLAAAAGIAAARMGRRALVLTVDPARRLAQALGIEGALERPVDVAVPRLPKGGSLRALQIDPKSMFERLLPRIAPPAVVARIHANRLYAGLVDSLPGVLEYMGVEALAEHADDDSIDLIVLDTPPAARGLDFLEAPDRMVQLLSNDALRWFLRSDSLLSKALSGASRGAAAVLRLADKALGFGFLSDLADFFRVFDGLYDGFRERSETIAEQLSRAKFLVVSSPDAAPLGTAAEIAEAFAKRKADTALLLNRVPRRGSPVRLPRALDRLPALGIAEADGAAAELPFLLADRLVSQPSAAARS